MLQPVYDWVTRWLFLTSYATRNFSVLLRVFRALLPPGSDGTLVRKWRQMADRPLPVGGGEGDSLPSPFLRERGRGEGSLLRPGAARLRAARTACGPGGSLRTTGAERSAAPVSTYALAKHSQPFSPLPLGPGGKSCPAGPRTSSGPVHTDAVELAQLHTVVCPGDRLGNYQAAEAIPSRGERVAVRMGASL